MFTFFLQGQGAAEVSDIDFLQNAFLHIMAREELCFYSNTLAPHMNKKKKKIPVRIKFKHLCKIRVFVNLGLILKIVILILTVGHNNLALPG